MTIITKHSVNAFLKSAFIWFYSLALVIIFFPLTFLLWFMALPFDRKRVLTHKMLVCQSYIVVKMNPFWSLQTEGREKVQKGQNYVVISNHNSIIDILVANCLLIDYKWVSKIENTRVPVLGWYLVMARYFCVDRQNDESKVKLLSDTAEALKEGSSIMMFPEGTRSLTGIPGLFRRGAFVLALENSVPVLPVVIDGTADLLPKHGFIFGRGRNITVKVLDPVHPSDFGTTDPDAAAAVFRELISKELLKMRI